MSAMHTAKLRLIADLEEGVSHASETRLSIASRECVHRVMTHIVMAEGDTDATARAAQHLTPSLRSCIKAVLSVYDDTLDHGARQRATYFVRTL